MTDAPTFDLQAHSTASDGELGPAEVVAAAAAAGVELLALTDHDTVAGVSEALAAGTRHGVRVLPAIEISAIDADGTEPRELHILGYLIDHEDTDFTRALAGFLGDRERRTLRMRDALGELGFALDQSEIETRIAAGQPIGRPHLAGAVLRAPANADRLQSEGIDDIGSLIKAYLIEGKAAFRLRETPTIVESIDAIHAAGGVAIWAHPFWDLAEPREVTATIERFHRLGMDGVETFYTTHTEEQTRLAYGDCERLGMLTTGSADFHGPGNRIFSRFRAFDTHGLTPNLGPLGGGA